MLARREWVNLTTVAKRKPGLPAPIDDHKAVALPAPAKHAGGRPTKLTPEMLERVDKALRAGLYRKDAARWAGISPATFCNWLLRGEAQRKGKFREFLDAVVNAEQQTKNLMVGSVLVAAKKDWKAAAWWLERKFPHDWGKTDAHVEARSDLGDEAQQQEDDAREEFRLRYVEPENVFVPHELQQAAIKSKARYMAIVAGVGGGKTRTGAINCWDRILADDNPTAFYLLVAPDTINGEVMCEHFVAVAPRGWIKNPAGRGPSYARTWDLRNGARVQFRSADKPEKIVARRANGIWVDEFTILRAAAWRVSLRGRLSGTGKGSLGWAIFTGTPRGRNWAYDDIWCRTVEGDDNHDENYEGYTWPSYMNPAVDQVDVEEARRNLPPAYFAREWGASWEAFHGRIYVQWDTGTMSVPGLAQRPAPVGTVHYCGVDWGYAKPGCSLLARRLPSGVWHVLAEVHEAEQLPGWWVEKIAGQWRSGKAKTIWCDPAEPGRIATLVDEGMPARGADNSVAEGIRSVAKAIVQGRLLIDSSCVCTIRSMSEYRWKEDAKGNRKEEPEKENDHGADGVRLMIHSTETDRGLGEQITRSGSRVVPLDGR